MTEAQKHLREAIAHWEARHAPLYSSAALREEQRQELADAAAAIARGDAAAARPVLERWRSYHQYTGDWADTLSAGFAHHRLAELMAAALQALDSGD